MLLPCVHKDGWITTWFVSRTAGSQPAIQTDIKRFDLWTHLPWNLDLLFKIKIQKMDEIGDHRCKSPDFGKLCITKAFVGSYWTNLDQLTFRRGSPFMVSDQGLHATIPWLTNRFTGGSATLAAMRLVSAICVFPHRAGASWSSLNTWQKLGVAHEFMASECWGMLLING